MVKRSDGRWQERVKLPGMKKAKYFYGKTKAELLRKIHDYSETAEHGLTFREVADEWWEDAEPKLTYNSIKGYKPAKCRAIEEFGDEYIRELTPVQINKFITIFAKEHADKTVRMQLLVINLIFKYAVSMGYANFNIARDISVPSNLEKKKVTPPSPEDIAKIKQSSECTFGLFAIWALYTGMRRGELLALEWSDVNLAERTISITKSVYHVGNNPHIKAPKTATSIGVIPILDALLPYIKPKKKGLVFPNSSGGILTHSQFKHKWAAYIKEAGISCTPHQLRHAYATMLFENDIPPEEMQILLRHAQISTTMDVYKELRDNKRKKVFDKVLSVDI